MLKKLKTYLKNRKIQKIIKAQNRKVEKIQELINDGNVGALVEYEFAVPEIPEKVTIIIGSEKARAELLDNATMRFRGEFGKKLATLPVTVYDATTRTSTRTIK